jgi:ADP-ribose pyrophosphatase YjhB (NUDIX family)
MESTLTRARGLIVHNNHVLLLRRVKKGKTFYTFPGGRVEEGESVEQGLIRELKEETSLDVEPVEMLLETKNSKGDEVKIFRCRVTNADPKKLPKAKLIGEELERSSKSNQYHLEWVPVESFPKKGVKFAGNISIMPDIVR